MLQIFAHLLVWAAVFAPIVLFMVLPAILGWREERARRRTPEYLARQREIAAEEAELDRRKAVEAHRNNNESEHLLWLGHYESIGDGSMYFCPDCGHPHRRHWAECHAIESGITVQPKKRVS